MHPCLRAIACFFCAGLTASALCACQPRAGADLLPAPQTQPSTASAADMLPGPGSPSPLYRANLCPTLMSLGEDVADAAREHIGVRYRSGGASPSAGFDCSGFVYWVFSKQGVSVPRDSVRQSRAGQEVAKPTFFPATSSYSASRTRPTADIPPSISATDVSSTALRQAPAYA